MMAKQTSETLCRLLAAWVSGAPAGEVPPDFVALYRAADRHMLSAAACAALEETGLMSACPPETARRFRDARAGALRRTILMDAERQALTAFLEENGIWYAPLKGGAVNRVYPRYGTRQFADCDVLFDENRWRDVRDWMKRRGYRAVGVGTGAHDTYQKPPVYNFEMHRRLFVDEGNGAFSADCAAYYADVKARLVKDADDRFGYHLSDEDLSVFLVAHAYKHYSVSGTGLRTLLDLYLYERARPEMDGAYVDGELKKLGLDDFGAVCRSLAGKLFGPAPAPALTEKEREMLDWLESSGVYGTEDHRVRAGLRRLQDEGPLTARTKAKYLFQRVFPPWSWYRVNAPFAYRHRWTVPFFWTYRLCRGVLKGRKNLHEVSIVCARREQ